MMNALRHNKQWLVFTLVLAMVCTIGGVPALAMACAAQGAPVVAAQVTPEPAGESCRKMGKPGPCCCGPEAKATQPASADEIGASSHGECGCSLQAPPAPLPGDRKAATPVVHLGAVLPPSSPVSLQLPARAPRAFTAAASGPPRSPVRASSPSRAPPACL